MLVHSQDLQNNIRLHVIKNGDGAVKFLLSPQSMSALDATKFKAALDWFIRQNVSDPLQGLFRERNTSDVTELPNGQKLSAKTALIEITPENSTPHTLNTILTALHNAHTNNLGVNQALNSIDVTKALQNIQTAAPEAAPPAAPSDPNLTATGASDVTVANPAVPAAPAAEAPAAPDWREAGRNAAQAVIASLRKTNPDAEDVMIDAQRDAADAAEKLTPKLDRLAEQVGFRDLINYAMVMRSTAVTIGSNTVGKACTDMIQAYTDGAAQALGVPNPLPPLSAHSKR